jgi:DNA-binding GntR family transcriptional regulator
VKKEAEIAHPGPLSEMGFSHTGPHWQLSQIVASHLREQIISGKLMKGQFLRIDATAKSLGVSMTPVREGMLMLQNESFVRLIPRRGFVVNSFSKEDLLDLFWAQSTIGGELAFRAATRISKADMARLHDNQTQYLAAIKAGDRNAVARIGHQFHRIINLAAASPRLALLLGSLTKQLPNRFYSEIEGHLKDTIDYHPVILDAIRIRDAKAAGSLMTHHINSAGEFLVAMLERQGVWQSSTETQKPAVATRGKQKRATKKRRKTAKSR